MLKTFWVSSQMKGSYFETQCVVCISLLGNGKSKSEYFSRLCFTPSNIAGHYQLSKYEIKHSVDEKDKLVKTVLHKI